MVQEVEVGLKISTALTCTILDKVLMVLGEVYLGLRPALFPPIIQVILVYHQFLIVMLITEVDIGLTPANFMHITMVE